MARSTPATLKTKQRIMATSAILLMKFWPIWQRYLWRLLPLLLISITLAAILRFHALEIPILILLLVQWMLKYLVMELSRNGIGLVKFARQMRAKK